MLHPDRLFPSDPTQRAIARRLYGEVAALPIVSPHGHTDPSWFAQNEAFPDPASLFVKPDHYAFRMLYSQGIPLEQLGVPRKDGGETSSNSRAIWRLLASNWHLFRGTPTSMWLTHAFETVFGVTERLSAASADRIYDQIEECLRKPEYRPRALFERFNLEVLATTESPLDPLVHHKAIRESGWKGRVITAFRPDPVVDPEFEGFRDNLAELARITGKDTATWDGYLAALADRRLYFKSYGAASTDHGHPTAATADLPRAEAEKLFDIVRRGGATAEESELFRAQMLTEMARMSLEDGLVMQIHPAASATTTTWCSSASAATRVPTSRAAPSMCGR